MGLIKTTANSVFRDYVTDGVPASGKNPPVKADIRSLFGLVDPALTNARIAITANYSVGNADKGSTIALGGSAFYTLTLGAASGFDANFQAVILNEDNVVSGGFQTGRAKTIAINGYPSFILWPGQCFTVRNQNNVWRFDMPGRWRVQGLPVIYVDHSLGNDANDGMATGAASLQTIQAAVLIYEHFVDCNGFGPTIQVADGTFTENNVSHIHGIIGYHGLSITGNITTPANCVWQVSGSGNGCIQCRDLGLGIITGFKFVSTGTGNFFLNGGQLGALDFGYINFGANPVGHHLNHSVGGSMGWSGGTLTLTGNMDAFVNSGGEGHITMDGATISIPSALTFTNFVAAGPIAVISMTSMTFTGTGAGAGSTGRKYAVGLNAVLSLGATVLPGATAGITGTGGQVN